MSRSPINISELRDSFIEQYAVTQPTADATVQDELQAQRQRAADEIGRVASAGTRKEHRRAMRWSQGKTPDEIQTEIEFVQAQSRLSENQGKILSLKERGEALKAIFPVVRRTSKNLQIAEQNAAKGRAAPADPAAVVGAQAHPPVDELPPPPVEGPELTSNVVGYTRAGRPILEWTNGDWSTEQTVTVKNPRINEGQWTNIPTIFDGRRVDPENAERIVIESMGMDPDTGRILTGYGTAEEAESASVRRNQWLGSQYGPPPEKRDEAGNRIPQAGPPVPQISPEEQALKKAKIKLEADKMGALLEKMDGEGELPDELLFLVDVGVDSAMRRYQEANNKTDNEMRVLQEDEKFVTEIRQKVKHMVFGNPYIGEDPETFAEFMSKGSTYGKNIPFVGGFHEAGLAARMVYLGKKAEAGEATPQDQKEMADLYHKLIILPSHPQTTPAEVADLVVGSLSFVAELLASYWATIYVGGAGVLPVITKKMTQKTVEKTARYYAGKYGKEWARREVKRAGLKGFKAFFDRGRNALLISSVFALGPGVHRSVANTYRNMLGKKYKLTEDEAGEFMVTMVESGDDFLLAMARGFGANFIEALSEQSGALLRGPLRSAFAKIPLVGKLAGLKGWILKKYAVDNADRFGGKLTNVLREVQRIGYHGVIEEMGEERVNEILRFLTRIDEDLHVPSRHQWWVEFLGFSVMGTAIKSAEIGLNVLDKKAYERAAQSQADLVADALDVEEEAERLARRLTPTEAEGPRPVEGPGVEGMVPGEVEAPEVEGMVPGEVVAPREMEDVEVGTRVITDEGVGVVEEFTEDGVVVLLDGGESVEIKGGEGVFRLEEATGPEELLAGEAPLPGEVVMAPGVEGMVPGEVEGPGQIAEPPPAAPLTYRQLVARAKELGISARGTKADLIKRINDAEGELEQGDKPPDTAGIPADPWGMTKEEYIAAEGKRAIAEGATAADIEETGQKDVWAQVWEQETSDAPRDAVFPLHVLKSMNEDKRNQILKFNEGASKTWEEHQLDVRQRETDDPPQREPFEKERWERTWDEDRRLQFEGVKYKVPPHEYRAEKEKHKAAVAKAVREGKPVPAEVLKEYPDLAQKPTALTYRQLVARAKELGISASGTAADLRERISIAEEKGPRPPGATTKGIVVGARVRTPDGKTGEITKIEDETAAVLMDPVEGDKRVNVKDTQFVKVKDLESAEGPTAAQVQAAKDAAKKAKADAAKKAKADAAKKAKADAAKKAKADAAKKAKADAEKKAAAALVEKTETPPTPAQVKATEEAQRQADEGDVGPTEDFGPTQKDEEITQDTLDAMSDEEILKLAKAYDLNPQLTPDVLRDEILGIERQRRLFRPPGEIKSEVAPPVVGVRGRGISSKWAFAYRLRKKGKQGSKVVFITAGGAVRHGEVVGKDRRGFPVVMDPSDSRRHSIGRSTWIKILPREKRGQKPISPSEYDRVTSSINTMVREAEGTPEDIISGLDIVKSIEVTSSLDKLGKVLKRIFPHLNVSYIEDTGEYLIVTPNGRRIRIGLVSREELEKGQKDNLAAGDRAQSQNAINLYMDSWYNAMTPNIISKIRFKASDGTNMDLPATREQFRDMPYENQLLAATEMVGHGVIRGQYVRPQLKEGQSRVLAESIIRLTEGFWTDKTVRHEVFHFVFEMLSKSDQKVLTDEFGNEEKANDAYLSARKTRQEHPSSSVRKVFRKILAMGRAMARALGISVKRTAGQVWEDIGLDLEFAQEILLRPISKEVMRGRYQESTIRGHVGQLGEEVEEPGVGVPPGRIARGREEAIGVVSPVGRFEIGRPSPGTEGDPNGALPIPADEEITNVLKKQEEGTNYTQELAQKHNDVIQELIKAHHVKKRPKDKDRSVSDLTDAELKEAVKEALASVKRAGSARNTDKEAMDDLVKLISGPMDSALMGVFRGFRVKGLADRIQNIGWATGENAANVNARWMVINLAHSPDGAMASLRASLRKLKTFKDIQVYFASAFVRRVIRNMDSSPELSTYDKAGIIAAKADAKAKEGVSKIIGRKGVAVDEEKQKQQMLERSAHVLEALMGRRSPEAVDLKVNQFRRIQIAIDWMRDGGPRPDQWSMNVRNMADYLVLLVHGYSWSHAARLTGFSAIAGDREQLRSLTSKARKSLGEYLDVVDEEYGHNNALDILEETEEEPRPEEENAKGLRRIAWGRVKDELIFATNLVQELRDLLNEQKNVKVTERVGDRRVTGRSYSWAKKSRKHLIGQLERFKDLDKAEKALLAYRKWLKKAHPRKFLRLEQEAARQPGRRIARGSAYPTLVIKIRRLEAAVEKAKEALRPKSASERSHFMSDEVRKLVAKAEIAEKGEKAGREARLVVARNTVRNQIRQAAWLPKLYKKIGEVKAALDRADKRLREEEGKLSNADRNRLQLEREDLGTRLQGFYDRRNDLATALLESGKELAEERLPALYKEIGRVKAALDKVDKRLGEEEGKLSNVDIAYRTSLQKDLAAEKENAGEARKRLLAIFNVLVYDLGKNFDAIFVPLGIGEVLQDEHQEELDKYEVAHKAWEWGLRPRIEEIAETEEDRAIRLEATGGLTPPWDKPEEPEPWDLHQLTAEEKKERLIAWGYPRGDLDKATTAKAQAYAEAEKDAETEKKAKADADAAFAAKIEDPWHKAGLSRKRKGKAMPSYTILSSSVRARSRVTYYSGEFVKAELSEDEKTALWGKKNAIKKAEDRRNEIALELGRPILTGAPPVTGAKLKKLRQNYRLLEKTIKKLEAEEREQKPSLPIHTLRDAVDSTTFDLKGRTAAGKMDSSLIRGPAIRLKVSAEQLNRMLDDLWSTDEAAIAIWTYVNFDPNYNFYKQQQEEIDSGAYRRKYGEGPSRDEMEIIGDGLKQVYINAAVNFGKEKKVVRQTIENKKDTLALYGYAKADILLAESESPGAINKIWLKIKGTRQETAPDNDSIKKIVAKAEELLKEYAKINNIKTRYTEGAFLLDNEEEEPGKVPSSEAPTGKEEALELLDDAGYIPFQALGIWSNSEKGSQRHIDMIEKASSGYVLGEAPSQEIADELQKNWEGANAWASKSIGLPEEKIKEVAEKHGIETTEWSGEALRKKTVEAVKNVVRGKARRLQRQVKRYESGLPQLDPSLRRIHTAEAERLRTVLVKTYNRAEDKDAAKEDVKDELATIEDTYGPDVVDKVIGGIKDHWIKLPEAAAEKTPAKTKEETEAEAEAIQKKIVEIWESEVVPTTPAAGEILKSEVAMDPSAPAAGEISKRPQQKPPKPKVAMGDWTEHYGRMPSQDDTFEEAMAGLRLNKEQKELWKELLPILHAGTRGMPSFKVGPLEKSIKLPRGPGGRYVPNTHRIELNSNTLQPSNMARLLLHEAVHAATWDIVYLEAAESWGDSSVANIRSKRGLMASSVKMKRAHQRLLDILGYMTGIEETGIEKATIEYDWVDPGGQKRHYGQSDVGEMIAEAFTNPDFQRFLSTVKVPESSRYADLRGKTLLEAFIDIVKELLGISSKEAVTALEEVLGLSHTIMEEDMWRRLASERHGSLLPEVAMDPSAPAAVEISKPEVVWGSRKRGKWDKKEKVVIGEALGLVPHQMIDEEAHRLTVGLTPSEFESLNPPGGKEQTVEYILGLAEKGVALAPPFVTVEWDEEADAWQVSGHEGRSRTKAFRQLNGEVPMTVDLILKYERRYNLTDKQKTAPLIPDLLAKRSEIVKPRPDPAEAVEISKPEVGVEPTTRAGARDLAHLDAVERGHTEEARGLVKEAALKSGYVGPWYHHGTFSIEEGNFVFDVKPFGVHFGTRDAAEARPAGKMIDDFIKDLEIFKDEKDGLWYWSSSGEESEFGFMTKDQARLDADMTADKRAKDRDPNSSTLTEVYLRLGNAFRMSDMIGWDPVAIVRDLGNRGVVVKGKPTHHNIIRTLKGPPYGYDSVIYTNIYEDIGKDSVIVFHPKRIKSALPDIRDKDGAVIPVSQRFDPTKEDIRFEVGAPFAARPVSAEEDARYMERAMEGDEKAAGEMVDEMAPRAGYVRRLFHGATKTWTVMDARREPTTVGSEILKDWDEPKGLGWLPLFTSTSRTVAGTYGKVMELYAKPGERTVELDAEGGFFNKFQNPGKEGSILGNKFREGADVVVIKNVIDAMEGLKEVSTVVAIKDPSSVKSADPITRYKKGDSEVEAGRAKDGDIIPLSQRFDPTVEDIRFEVGMPVPAWVNEEAKGSLWKDLAKKVAKDVEGKHVGRANIAERLIEILNTEVRIGRVSIPRDQLAWFEDEFYQIRSRTGSVPEIYQRLGEAMAAMIQDKEARAAKEGQVVLPWWHPVELDLVDLAEEDLLAPSGEATAEHGVGRFFQLYIEKPWKLYPDLVETMEELIGSRAPNYLQAMRDAARVDAIHRKRSEIAQNRSISVVPGSSRGILKRFDEYLGKIMTDLFSGSEAFNRIHRSTFKALARVSLGLARNVTKTLAGTSADYRLAYDTYLRVPQEISRIMEGSREVQEEHEEYKGKMKKWGVKMNRWEEKDRAAKAKGVDPPPKPTKPVQPEAKEGIRVFARGLLVDNPVNYTRTEMRKFLSEGEIKELEDAGLIIPVKAASGEYVYLSPKSFRAIMDGVGDKAKWEEFEFYAQGKAEHARYKAVEEDNAAKRKRYKEKLEKWEKNKSGRKPVPEKMIPRAWPGQEVFENYEKLLETVNKLEEDNPHFKESFKELEHFLNQLLLIQVYSGERTAGDVVRMVNKYTDYMPLTRKFRGSLEFTGPGRYPATPSRAAMGAESAKLSSKDEGSTLPFLSLEAAVRERVAGTITAYYENSVMLSVRDYAVKLASGTFKDEDTGEIVDIPLDVRTLGHQLMTEVDPVIRIQGRVSPEQMRDELAKAINRNLKKFGLEKPIEAGHLEVEGPGIALVKATKPNAIRIVAPFDWAADHTPVLRPKLDAEGEPVTDEGGRPVLDEVEMYDRRRPMSGRRFYQISDPILYDAFKFSKSPGKFIAGYENWLGPITKAWKRRLTQNFVFGVWNLKRDPFTILALSEELGISIKKKKGETGDQYRKRLSNEAAPLLIGSAHGAALLNKLFGWYPDAAEVGEMLSMAMDSNMRHRRRKGVQGFWDGFKEMMKEDIWSPGYFSLPMAERISKAPGIIHGAITKPLDVFLYITFQRAWAVRTEKLGRQGSYVLAKARGATTEQAQAASDRAPGHFANRPLSGNAYALYRTAGFANPAIQILYQHYAKWRDPDWRNVGQYAAGRMGMISVYAVIAAVVNWHLTPDDEKEKMRLRPDDERMRYMSVFGKFRLPFDYGIPGIIESFTYNLTESMLIKSKIPTEEFVKKAITGLLDVPGHPTAMIHPWLKTLVLEVPGDFSFFYGKDYIPPHLKQQWPENPERQYYDSTPQLYVEIGRLTGQSPLRIQHIIRGLFTSQAEELIKGYENLANGKYASKMDELEGPDRIVLGRLLQREPRGWRAQPTRDIGTVRRQLDAAKRILAIMMDGSENPEELQEQIDKVQELTKNSRWYGMLATNWEQIRKLRKMAPSSENEERIRMLERSMAVIANEQTMVDAEQLKKDGRLTTSVDNLAKFGITVFAPRFTKGPTTYFVQDVDLWDQTLSVVDRKLGAWAHRRLRLAPGQRPNADQRAAARKMAIKYKNHAWGRHLKTRRQLDKYLETGQIAAIRTP